MKTALHAAAARHARRRALTRDLRFWHATAKRNALLRRVFTICEKAWRAHVRVHGVHLSPEDVPNDFRRARRPRRLARRRGETTPRARQKSRARPRGDVPTPERLAPASARVARGASRGRERESARYATFADAFASWRVEAKTAAAVREEAASRAFLAAVARLARARGDDRRGRSHAPPRVDARGRAPRCTAGGSSSSRARVDG